MTVLLLVVVEVRRPHRTDETFVNIFAAAVHSVFLRWAFRHCCVLAANHHDSMQCAVHVCVVGSCHRAYQFSSSSPNQSSTKHNIVYEHEHTHALTINILLILASKIQSMPNIILEVQIVNQSKFLFVTSFRIRAHIRLG